MAMKGIGENKRDKIFLWNQIYSGICTFGLSFYDVFLVILNAIFQS